MFKITFGTTIRQSSMTMFIAVNLTKAWLNYHQRFTGCLPPGERVSEHIFDFILRRLSHRDDTHVFKLCKPYNDETTRYTTFNCCRIVGDRNSAICADYWSVVVDWALPVVVFIFICHILFNGNTFYTPAYSNLSRK